MLMIDARWRRYEKSIEYHTPPSRNQTDRPISKTILNYPATHPKRMNEIANRITLTAISNKHKNDNARRNTRAKLKSLVSPTIDDHLLHLLIFSFAFELSLIHI